MNPNKKRIELLWNKFLQNQASGKEVDELFHYIEYISSKNGQLSEDDLFSFIDKQLELGQTDTTMEADSKAVILREVLRSGNGFWSEDIPPSDHPPLSESNMRRIPFYRRWQYVAVVLLILTAGFYAWLHPHQTPAHLPTPTDINLIADIEPGREGAILTLADGTKVVLDSLGNGVVATQNGSEIVLKNGQLAYDPTGITAGEISYNTITTPKGRQFSLVLPDGTRVWLNAASSLTYPTAFSGAERKVEVTGEAYFEVVSKAKMPFRVMANRAAEVKVLGTQFNVKAYADEATINTTLLEGSVTVTSLPDATLNKGMKAGGNPLPDLHSNRLAVILTPGQQAQLPVGKELHNKITVVDKADIEKVMAWKNGLFNFNGTSLTVVMKQLERWYDIEVVYEKGVKDIELEGKMTRDVSLKGLLRILENLGVRAQLEGRRLTLLL